ncbi:hypothetical protein EDB80DRAFT_673553 [Ilyonectria destructans]|nr:hypothetical protein EDB80DRAFT_673553 [Ilyonectria destructans]
MSRQEEPTGSAGSDEGSSMHPSTASYTVDDLRRQTAMHVVGSDTFGRVLVLGYGDLLACYALTSVEFGNIAKRCTFFSNKTFAITGGESGMGRESARVLASKGAAVIPMRSHFVNSIEEVLGED